MLITAPLDSKSQYPLSSNAPHRSKRNRTKLKVAQFLETLPTQELCEATQWSVILFPKEFGDERFFWFEHKAI
jgi:hypothetical protein